MTKLTALTVDNLDLLHALAQPDPGRTIKSLGEQLARDDSNTGKTLKRLREDGMVAEAALALTDQGHAVTRLLAADAEIRADDATLLLTHAELEPDPQNARTDVDDFAINALREDILRRSRPGRVGLLQALTVIPPAVLGQKWRMRGGYRRWLAIERAIRFEELPADAPIPCIRWEGLSDADAAIMAIVENVQRVDLHPLDEGGAYARLVREFGLSVDAIAAAVSKSKKHVQDRIALTEKLDDDAKRRMRLPDTDDDHLTYAGARRLMQSQNPRPKPAIDVTDKEALALMEVADRVARQPSHAAGYTGKQGWTQIPDTPAGGAASSLVGKGLIEIAEPYGSAVFVRLAPARAAEIHRWIADKGLAPLWSARAAVLGSGIAADLETSRRYASSWLNEPLPEPEPPAAEPEDDEEEETLEDDETPLLTRAAGEGDPAEHGGGGPTAPPASFPPIQDAIDRLNAERAAEPGSDPLPPYLQRLAGVKDPEPQLPTLTEAQARTLFDVAAKIANDPQQGPNGAYTGAAVFAFYKHPADQFLVMERLARFVTDAKRSGQLVVLTERGLAWLGARPPTYFSLRAPYETPWLNPPVAETPAPQPQSGGAGPAAPTEGAATTPMVYFAKPVIAPPVEFTCGNCEQDFEISDEIETDDIPNCDAIDSAMFTPPREAACPHCGCALQLLRAEVHIIEWETA